VIDAVRVGTALWVLGRALAMVVFVNRYLGGVVMRFLRRASWDATVDDYLPAVTVVIPLFNELLTRIPDFEAGDPDLLGTNFMRGVKRMPFRFTPEK